MKEELIFVLYGKNNAKTLLVFTCVHKPCIPDICSHCIFMLVMLCVLYS